MKSLPKKARKLIQLLVHTTDSVGECLEKAGVPSSTFYGRWRKDPLFIDALIEERQVFESEVRGQFVSKRRRIEELMQLYEKTPLESSEYWQNGTLKRVWVNVNEKRAIIKQIKEEMEGLDIRLGDPGAKDDMDLIERRRKADEDLEKFQAELAKAEKENQATEDDGS